MEVPRPQDRLWETCTALEGWLHIPCPTFGLISFLFGYARLIINDHHLYTSRKLYSEGLVESDLGTDALIREVNFEDLRALGG